MTEYQFEGFNEARDAVHGTAVEKGWWEPQERIVALPLQDGPRVALVERTFGELMGLVHSEVSEALEDHRNGRAEDKILWSYSAKQSGARVNGAWWTEEGTLIADTYDDDEVAITPENAERYGFVAKPEGIPIELADVIIRVLDIAGHYGIDIQEALAVKAKYNKGRPHRHGGKVL